MEIADEMESRAPGFAGDASQHPRSAEQAHSYLRAALGRVLFLASLLIATCA
jgi:hypothetical protein